MGRLRLAPLCGVVVVLVAGSACRERAQQVQSEAELKDMVYRMMPLVAQAAGLPFKREPLVLRRSRAQVRDYVIHKFDQDVPAAELAHVDRTLGSRRHEDLVLTLLRLHAAHLCLTGPRMNY